MLTDVIQDYAPVLSPEEKRGIALIYTSLSPAASAMDRPVDGPLRALMPAILQNPEILSQLLSLLTSPSLFGARVGAGDGETDLLTHYSRALYGLDLVYLAATRAVPFFGLTDEMLAVCEILPLAHAPKIITLGVELALNGTATIIGNSIVAAPLAEKCSHQGLVTLLRSLTPQSHDPLGVHHPLSLEALSKMLSLLTENSTVFVPHTTLLSPAALTPPEDSAAQISATSALEYLFMRLRGEQGEIPPVVTFLRDDGASSLVYPVTLYRTEWIPNADGRLVEHVVTSSRALSWRDASGAIAPSGSTFESYTGVRVLLLESGEAVIPATQIAQRFFGILGETSDFLVQDGDTTFSPDNFQTGAFIGNLFPFVRADDDEEDGVAENRAPTAPPNNTGERIYARAAEAPVMSHQPPPIPPPYPPGSTPQGVLPSQAALEDANRPATTDTASPSTGSDVISRAFWWGADRTRSWRG